MADKRPVFNRVVGDKPDPRPAHLVRYPNIPLYDWASRSVNAAPARLNRASRSAKAQQETIAGENSVIRIVMGLGRVGAAIPTAITHGNYLYLLCVWCKGPVDAIEAVELFDAKLPTGITRVDYLGDAGNVVDPWLQAAFAAKGLSYTQTLPGVCYSVLKARAGTTSGFPRAVARVRGLKLRQTEAGSPVYADNAAYMIAEIVTNSTWGLGEKIDWSSVTSSAALFDAMVGSEKRRRLSLVCDSEQDIKEVLRSVCDYSGVWLPKEGDTYRIVPDVAGTSSGTLTSATIKSIGTCSKRGSRDTPTMVRAWWTDTTQRPWKRRPAQVPDAIAGGVPRRVASVERPGVTSYAEAIRYATERLNRATLCDLALSDVVVFDQGVTFQVGEIKTVTWAPLNIVAKDFRIVASRLVEPGRWSLDMEEYDPAVYSSAVAAAPTLIDTPVESPGSPPLVTGVTAVEQTYALENGVTASRIKVAWTAPSFMFTRHFRVTVTAGATVVHTGTAEASDTSYITPALQEGAAYSIAVSIVSATGVTGASGAASVTLNGKAIAPGNVATLSGLEAGGRVFLQWTQADNLTVPGTPDPDVWRYELRYGATGGSFATATVLDQVDALTYVAETIPPGTWRFYVVAIDSVKQQSATPATRDITITLDSGAYTAQAHTFTTATLTNMVAWTARPNARTFWTTDFGDGLGYGADNTNNAVGTFGDSLASTVWPQPHTAGNSAWESEAWDAGSLLSGTWQATADYTLHSGTATVSILLSATGAGGSWVTYPGTSAKASGRFAKVRFDFTTGSGTVNGYPSITLSQTPRSESVASVTTNASGGKFVQLANNYSVVRSLQLTPLGSAFATAIADRILVSPETGLMLAFDLSASGSVFQLFNNSVNLSRLIIAGDYLEFDVRAFPTNPNLSATFGIYATYSDASNSGHYSTASAGVWTAIKTALTAGKTMNGVNFAGSSSVAGSYACQIRNVRITDGAGTTRATLWSSGEPPQNSTTSSTAATNIRMGPANSFLAYAFNTSGQISRDVSVKFEGS